MLREMLIEKTVNLLHRNGYNCFRYGSGCFDLAARKEKTFLLKILINIDSFQYEQSRNLALLSKRIEAQPSIIGFQTRYEKLENDIVYERFGLPAFSYETFHNIIENDFPVFQRSRGGLFVEINPEKLRNARMKNELSQKELAEKIGVNKKTIYEHERGKKLASKETAERMEKALRIRITENVDIEDFTSAFAEKKPGKSFEIFVDIALRKMGFETSFLEKAPFNFVTSSNEITIISDAEADERKIAKKIPYISKFSELTEKPALIIMEHKGEFSLPTIEKKELSRLDSPKALMKMIRKW
jgi:putative transcriptional regulator